MVARAKGGFIISDQTRSNAIRLDNVSAVPASPHSRQQGSPAAASSLVSSTQLRMVTIIEFYAIIHVILNRK